MNKIIMLCVIGIVGCSNKPAAKSPENKHVCSENSCDVKEVGGNKLWFDCVDNCVTVVNQVNYH